jgi:non-ribosomal peptide synthetase component F
MPAQRPPAPDVERLGGQARQHSIADLLRRTARRAPGKIAIVYRDRRQTYADPDVRELRTTIAPPWS